MESKLSDLETLAIDTVRVLAVDAVQKANSGHPGTAMALAPVAHVLWTKFLQYNPRNADWPGRDRFILSPGHACILLYNFLYLTGYDLSMDDLKQFRQLHSKTPGHPEYGRTQGVEVTTGPLGQGFANGVGMAIAQQSLAARFNRPGFDLFNYHIYGICSDGDMMEGISGEAASLAGHLQLGNIIFLYDDNHITIEGDTNLAFSEDVAKRFEAYDWHVQDIADVNDTRALSLALANAKAEQRRPSLIRVRSLIAYGSPGKSGSATAHGSPLGAEEVRLVKQFFGFDPDKSFIVPDDVLRYYRAAGERGSAAELKWHQLFMAYQAKYPGLAREWTAAYAGDLPKGWKDDLPVFPINTKLSTRDAGSQAVNTFASRIPQLIGGSADLSPSTKTHLKEFDSFTHQDRFGRNLHFGIREHSMGAVLNGMALTRGIISFGSTFLIFSEYMRPPIRLAAIMKISPIIVYTHDSIGLGEDGTTHQPVEQLASLRSIPNITLIRPADANETVQAWRVALEHSTGPVILVLTRQGLPVLPRNADNGAERLEKGAYIYADADGGVTPQLILIGTGSELNLVWEAKIKLEKQGFPTRVVSMPSWELFEKQDPAYKELVFPATVRKRLAVEMASALGWLTYTTEEGAVLGMSSFGESAPAEVLYNYFGFTAENVVKKAKQLLR